MKFDAWFDIIVGSLMMVQWGFFLARGKVGYPAAIGMLPYSVIINPGYFAQQGQWTPVGMFAILFILALISLGSVIRTNSIKSP